MFVKVSLCNNAGTILPLEIKILKKYAIGLYTHLLPFKFCMFLQKITLTYHLIKRMRALALLVCLGATSVASAQSLPAVSAMTDLPLNDMTVFRPVADNWSIAGEVTADRNQKEAMKAGAGKGMVVNIPTEKKRDNLVTVMEHGDLELELDFMMAKGSNSGIYLQGRYEIQLYDSWGVKSPTTYDCGAIYERWDDSKPEGQKGYQGSAPRVNVSRAPGLWQHYYISFQAPRFNAQGQKIQNARILEVVHNGVVIHENVELTGPTRSSMSSQEVAIGPLLLQGDHGPVAFRNIRYKSYDKAPLSLSNLKYSYYGKFDKAPDFTKLKAEVEGSTPDLTREVIKAPNDFVVRYAGTLPVKEAGAYTFTLVTGGSGSLKVNNYVVIPMGGGTREGKVSLQPGNHPVEIVYAKFESWISPSLGLFAEGPGIRRQALHAMNSVPMRRPADPIMLEANGNHPRLLRSFVDFQRKSDARAKRITHAINVGSSLGAHYTMDLNNGALVQVWKGDFLNTAPMWHDRGDGSSRPLGSPVLLNDAPLLQVLSNINSPWIDTLSNESAYRFKGYDIDESGRPLFRYSIYGVEVEDLITPEEGGKIITRSLKVNGPNAANLYLRLAEGSDIVKLGDGFYAVNGNEYYVKVEAGGGKPLVRTVNKRQELLVPVTGIDKGANLRYALIW